MKDLQDINVLLIPDKIYRFDALGAFPPEGKLHCVSTLRHSMQPIFVTKRLDARGWIRIITFPGNLQERNALADLASTASPWLEVS